ncbi:MAG: uroporphyrinogen-III synthase [Balneolaceae bacterium]|nr:uroporphyrinogen-III synthase [Balneolaceae bacterium]
MPLVLLTAAEEDVEETLEKLSASDLNALHLPLERYVPVEAEEKTEELLGRLDEFEQIAYGSLRNARFFLEAVRERGLLEEVRGRVNLAVNPRTASWLEERDVPAICADLNALGQSGDGGSRGGRAIDLMEFLLRLRRTGPTLYPCGLETPEELPGLLRELDMPVEELVLFRSKGPGEDRLEAYRTRLAERPPDAVVFHSRRAVVRTLAAFPELDLDAATLVTADTGITQKLREEGAEADLEAGGSWESIVEKLAGAWG